MKKITIATGEVVEVKPAGNGTIVTSTSYKPERIFKDAIGNFYARSNRSWHKVSRAGKDIYELM